MQDSYFVLSSSLFTYLCTVCIYITSLDAHPQTGWFLGHHHQDAECHHLLGGILQWIVATLLLLLLLTIAPFHLLVLHTPMIIDPLHPHHRTLWTCMELQVESHCYSLYRPALWTHTCICTERRRPVSNPPLGARSTPTGMYPPQPSHSQYQVSHCLHCMVGWINILHFCSIFFF